MEGSLKEVSIGVEVSDTKIKSLITHFLSGKSKNTIEAYSKDLEDFTRFIKVSSIDEAARILLSSSHGDANGIGLSYQNSLLEKGLQSATINRRLASLRSLVGLARVLGIVPWSLEVKNLKVEPYRDTRGPGLNYFEKMLSILSSKNRPKDKRDMAILRLMYDLALRVSEVVNIDYEDLSLKDLRLKILGKGKRTKLELSLPESTVAAINDWFNVSGNCSGPLFTNFDRSKKGQTSRLSRIAVYEMVRKLGKEVGVITRPHGIRHLSITEACKLAQENGYGLEEVLDHSRHSSVETLMIYRDRDRNIQRNISSLVARKIGDYPK